MQQNGAELCDEISSEVREIASWLASGKLTPELFRQAVITLEAAKVARFGFTLTGATSPDGRTKFSLRFADTKELCSEMVFNPETEELSINHVC